MRHYHKTFEENRYR